MTGTSTRSFGNSRTFQSSSITPNYFKKQKNKNDTDPNLVRGFCSSAFLSEPYGWSSFVRAFTYGCDSAPGRSMSITISLIAGRFDHILSWPFKRTIQINVFRRDNSGLIWTNLKTDDKNTPCFSRPSPLQLNPSCGILFYLPHEEIFKTHKILIKNDNVYIQIKILDFSWTPVSIPTIVNPGRDVVFDIQQREKEKKNFKKLELKTVIFYIRHFECRCANSNTSSICLHPLQN